MEALLGVGAGVGAAGIISPAQKLQPLHESVTQLTKTLALLHQLAQELDVRAGVGAGVGTGMAAGTATQKSQPLHELIPQP